MLGQLSQDDKALWQSLRKGDRKAFEMIYQVHVKALHHYGMRFSVDETHISDCLHDVFVEIWQKREQLTEDMGNIRFYLIKALRHRLLRFIETQKRTVLSDDMSAYHFDFESAHEATLIQDEEGTQRIAHLNKALETLSTRQREALFLRFYQNLSYQEIARIMDVEQQSAYNLIFRGVEVLRKFYA
jgi:RNA polymerase sigma factor (sigma-70 family)